MLRRKKAVQCGLSFFVLVVMLVGMNKKNKKEKMSLDSKLVRITLVVSILSLLLSVYTFVSLVHNVKYNDMVWEANGALNKRSAETRRAVESLVECEVNPEMCSQIDWSEPYAGYLVD